MGWVQIDGQPTDQTEKMVLTRSSYSRLGTPLTSPLTNPAKPRSSTKSARTKTPRNSLSSAATSITASEPPLTPNNLQFGFDLIDRLAHQQDLDPVISPLSVCWEEGFH
ncbi:hypothetical protein VP01_147g2 [Puccinia sorghi]|uniref:Uncharacterized protein n=1 Tax=Puccinia sorghi TaxID=27349 RepID=A0A0L6VLE5_9BASI|nr:hypothetical protein VP01_147g2 [Puccinia sorghi]